MIGISTLLITSIPIILGSLLVIILNAKKHRTVSNATPENISDMVKFDDYQKWKKYSADSFFNKAVTEVITMIIILLLLWTGAYASFASLFPQDMFWHDLSFIIIMVVVYSIEQCLGIIKYYQCTPYMEKRKEALRNAIKNAIFQTVTTAIALIVLELYLRIVIYDGAIKSGLFGGKPIIMILFVSTIFSIMVILFVVLLLFILSKVKKTEQKLMEDGEYKDSLMAMFIKHDYYIDKIEIHSHPLLDAKIHNTTLILKCNSIEQFTPDELSAYVLMCLKLSNPKLKILFSVIIAIPASIATLSVPAILTFYSDFITFIFGFPGNNLGFIIFLLYILFKIVSGVYTIIHDLIVANKYNKTDDFMVKSGYGEQLIAALKKATRDTFTSVITAFNDVITNSNNKNNNNNNNNNNNSNNNDNIYNAIDEITALVYKHNQISSRIYRIGTKMKTKYNLSSIPDVRISNTDNFQSATEENADSTTESATNVSQNNNAYQNNNIPKNNTENQTANPKRTVSKENAENQTANTGNTVQRPSNRPAYVPPVNRPAAPTAARQTNQAQSNKTSPASAEITKEQAANKRFLYYKQLYDRGMLSQEQFESLKKQLFG